MGFDTTLTRRELLGGAAGGMILPWLQSQRDPNQPEGNPLEISPADLAVFEKVAGLSFTDEQRQKALGQVRSFRNQYRNMRTEGVPYDLAPATPFVTVSPRTDPMHMPGVTWPETTSVAERSREDLSSATVAELSTLIKTKKISSVELTQICLDKLKKYGPKLKCVVNLTEERALQDAGEADAMLAKGTNLGPLHGIPCGVKDLFAMKGTPTTWGAEPFQDQVLNYDSAVVRRLRLSGAVICAKLSLGALAMDDKWFGGQTLNPWKPAEGSSGSSAGSASAVAAGLLPFAIGTETLGSIVSPSHRCRVTGLRPSFGWVSRYGAMALSWTMDKAGPICRTAEDALLILSCLAEYDPRDSGSVNRSFSAHPVDVRKLKIGVLSDDEGLDQDDSTSGNWRKLLEEIGVKPEVVQISAPPDIALLGLSVEAAAAFDEITRDGRVDLMKYSPWANMFRQHRYVTAVEYVQSLRVRSQLMARFEKELGDFDLVLAGSRGSHLLLTTNLTGHPQLYVPLGADERNRSVGFSIIGRLYEDYKAAALGWEMQKVSGFYKQLPDLTALEGLKS